MDRIAERCSEWFGSAPFIVAHVVWFVAWFALHGDTNSLTLIVSLEAIFLSLFILRAENVQSHRTDAQVAADLAKSDEVLRLLRSLLGEG